MKCFALLPVSKSDGVLYDDGKLRPARFLTPAEAKFEASFKTVREARK